MSKREIMEKILTKLKEDIELWKPIEDSDFDNDFKCGIRQGLQIAIHEVKGVFYEQQ